MRAYSVVAVVRPRDDDREELALLPRERARLEHDLLVELDRALEHRRAQAHRLDDVEDLAGAPDCGLVLLLQPAGRLVDVDQAEVGHRGDLRTPQRCVGGSEDPPTHLCGYWLR